MRSVWISFGGRVVAQIVGATASVLLGLFVVGKYKLAEKVAAKDTTAVEQANHLSRHRKDRPSGELALAVLPLQNYSADAKNAYFADGVTEALITDLAQINGLRVTSRTSSMAYKGSTKPLPEISRELGVDLVLEGSIVRDAKRVRVTAQLIDADTDDHLWARSYDRASRDVLSLQAEVATAIAREVNVAVAPRLVNRFAKPATIDPAVYDSYLEGMQAWRTRTPRGLQAAAAKFADVVAREPNFAPAHAALADTYGLLGLPHYRDIAPPDAIARARLAANHAVALDEGLAEAHGTLAWLRHFYDWDWPGAEKEYRRALELNPGYAVGHMRYAVFLADLGRTRESATEAARAVELDPLSATVLRTTGMAHYLSRRFDQAAAAERRSLEIDPGNASSALILAWTLLASGAPREALTAGKGIPASPVDRLQIMAMLAIALHRAGDVPLANAATTALLREPDVPADVLLRLHAGSGDTSAALAALDTAIRDRLDIVTGLKVDPLFDRLRGEPRFQSLVARVGFP